MRNKKLFSALGLSVILSQLISGCGEKTEVKPIEFEQPEQPVVSAPVEAENNGEYVVIDESIIEAEMDDDTLEELGCFVATTDELAEAEKKASTTLASQYGDKSEASTQAVTPKAPATPKAPPVNPNDQLVSYNDGSAVWIDSVTGKKYVKTDDYPNRTQYYIDNPKGW